MAPGLACRALEGVAVVGRRGKRPWCMAGPGTEFGKGPIRGAWPGDQTVRLPFGRFGARSRGDDHPEANRLGRKP
jgi:hypothetical protein